MARLSGGVELWDGELAKAFQQRLDVAPAEAQRHVLATWPSAVGLEVVFGCACGWRARLTALDADVHGAVGRLLDECVVWHNRQFGAPSIADLTDLGWFDPEASA